MFASLPISINRKNTITIDERTKNLVMAEGFSLSFTPHAREKKRTVNVSVKLPRSHFFFFAFFSGFFGHCYFTLFFIRSLQFSAAHLEFYDFRVHATMRVLKRNDDKMGDLTGSVSYISIQCTDTHR